MGLGVSGIIKLLQDSRKSVAEQRKKVQISA